MPSCEGQRERIAWCGGIRAPLITRIRPASTKAFDDAMRFFFFNIPYQQNILFIS